LRIGLGIVKSDRKFERRIGMANSHRDEKPLGELLSELTQGMSKMFRQEVDLAKTEISRKARQRMKDAAFLVMGGFIVYAGFLALMGAVIAALWTIAPLWLSALAVGILVCGIGYYLIRKGLRELKRGLKPEQTVESLKEDKKWIKEQI
jgi:uncharacterized membrane protein YqjE